MSVWTSAWRFAEAALTRFFREPGKKGTFALPSLVAFEAFALVFRALLYPMLVF
jgi:hypothetical protein